MQSFTEYYIKQMGGKCVKKSKKWKKYMGLLLKKNYKLSTAIKYTNKKLSKKKKII